jgi:hypothetical protein
MKFNGHFIRYRHGKTGVESTTVPYQHGNHCATNPQKGCSSGFATQTISPIALIRFRSSAYVLCANKGPGYAGIALRSVASRTSQSPWRLIREFGVSSFPLTHSPCVVTCADPYSAASLFHCAHMPGTAPEPDF